MKSKTANELLISYLTLRKIVGWLGILLPIILIVFGTLLGDCVEIQSSISAYFHTSMRDVFTIVVSAIALFLFAYRGYDMKDNMICTSAGIAALLVALCPTYIESPTLCMNHVQLETQRAIIGDIHFAAAVTFFMLIMVMTMGQFTQSDKQKTPQKIRRNRLYKICGMIIFFALFAIGIYFSFLKEKLPLLEAYKPVFWLETIALWALGIAWLVKGEALLKDKA